MKYTKWLVMFLLVIVSAFAAESAPVEVKAPVPVKVNYKDAFLKFALDKAEKYSDKAEQTVVKTVDIAMKEAPELAREFLVWRAWKNGLTFLTYLIMPFILGIICFKLVKTAQNAPSESGVEFVSVLCAAIFGIWTILMILVLLIDGLSALMDLIQILVAPRIYIIEQLTNMLK